MNEDNEIKDAKDEYMKFIKNANESFEEEKAERLGKPDKNDFDPSQKIMIQSWFTLEEISAIVQALKGLKKK